MSPWGPRNLGPGVDRERVAASSVSVLLRVSAAARVEGGVDSSVRSARASGLLLDHGPGPRPSQGRAPSGGPRTPLTGWLRPSRGYSWADLDRRMWPQGPDHHKVRRVPSFPPGPSCLSPTSPGDLPTALPFKGAVALSPAAGWPSELPYGTLGHAFNVQLNRQRLGWQARWPQGRQGTQGQ